MNCAEFADVTAELALGVLTGRERADALAHLDQCDACRARVDQLTTAGERLIGLLPSTEPPPGFAARVLERLGLVAPGARPGRHRREQRRVRGATTRPFWKKLRWLAGEDPRTADRPDSGLKPSRRSRRMLASAAVTVAAAGAALGGWGLHAPGTASASGPPELNSATLLAAGHQEAGEVFVYNRDPQWMHVTVHLASGSRTWAVICQLESADGRVTTVGSFPLTGGSGSWGSPVWLGDGAPVGVRLVTTDGTVLATASFPKA